MPEENSRGKNERPQDSVQNVEVMPSPCIFSKHWLNCHEKCYGERPHKSDEEPWIGEKEAGHVNKRIERLDLQGNNEIQYDKRHENEKTVERRFVWGHKATIPRRDDIL